MQELIVADSTVKSTKVYDAIVCRNRTAAKAEDETLSPFAAVLYPISNS